MSADAAATMPQAIGPYQIEKRLGQGGMGTVFLAVDSRLDRKVALKICHIADNPQAMERFKREAKAAAALRHPNLCPIFEFNVQDGTPYFTMAFIEGPTLDRWIAQRGGLTQREAAILVRKLALALQAAHEKGVVHRDLKPSNIAMEKGEPVVLDFGLARQGGNDAAESRLTKSGAILGTPSYMAPEQVEGKIDVIGPTSDIYSLGVVLYELVTGHVPFEGPTTSVLAHILISQPPMPRQYRAELDPRLEAITLKAMAKRPEDRFSSMGEFAAALTEWARSAPAGGAKVVQSRDGSIAPTMGTAAHTPPPLPGTVPVAAAAPTAIPSAIPVGMAALAPEATAPIVVPPTTSRPSRRKKAQNNPLKLMLIGGGFALGVVLLGLLIWSAVNPRGNKGTPAKDGAAVKDGKSNGKNDGKSSSGPSAAGPAITNSIGMQLVPIPAGKFIMGSPFQETDRQSDETPHEVEISRLYYLGAHEVTQAQYEAVTRTNPSWFRPGGSGRDKVASLDAKQLPVEQVSWNDAVEFCRLLSELPEEKRAGRSYRLPSEAEWEYGCREAGKVTAPFHFGYSLSASKANFDGNFPYGGGARGQHLGRPEPVGSYSPNALGLHDMHGNVWEWCGDWYDKDSYISGVQRDPRGPVAGTYRVLRGGSWDSYGKDCRAAARNQFSIDFRNNFLGFRVAMTVR